MGLTLGEKSYWRDRIAKRIGQRGETPRLPVIG